MTDFRKALDDIGDIRLQLAAATTFRGFGPGVLGVTGILAFGLAAAQSLRPGSLPDWGGFLGHWVGIAVFATGLIGLTMVTRTRRHHGRLAQAMLVNAFEHFTPFGIAGAMLCVIVVRFAPDLTWILPGLWQLLAGLGLFAAARFLPRSIMLAAAWYFVCGNIALLIGSETRSFDPWIMGLPFGGGQLLAALLLQLDDGAADAAG